MDERWFFDGADTGNPMKKQRPDFLFIFGEISFFHGLLELWQQSVIIIKIGPVVSMRVVLRDASDKIVLPAKMFRGNQMHLGQRFKKIDPCCRIGGPGFIKRHQKSRCLRRRSGLVILWNELYAELFHHIKSLCFSGDDFFWTSFPVDL